MARIFTSKQLSSAQINRVLSKFKKKWFGWEGGCLDFKRKLLVYILTSLSWKCFVNLLLLFFVIEHHLLIQLSCNHVVYKNNYIVKASSEQVFTCHNSRFFVVILNVLALSQLLKKSVKSSELNSDAASKLFSSFWPILYIYTYMYQ